MFYVLLYQSVANNHISRYLRIPRYVLYCIVLYVHTLTMRNSRGPPHCFRAVPVYRLSLFHAIYSSKSQTSHNP